MSGRGSPGLVGLVPNARNPVPRLVRALEQLRRAFPPGHTGNRYTLTVLRAGLAPNVVPTEAEATVDCRIVPGSSPEAALQEIQAVIGDPEIGVELDREGRPTASPAAREFIDALSEAIRTQRPEATIETVTGWMGSDAKHLRPLRIPCYGLIPFELTAEELGSLHGVDECVSVDNLMRGLRIVLGVVERLCLTET